MPSPSKSKSSQKLPYKKTKVKKITNEPHANWKSNYKIVKETCESVAKLATNKSDGDGILRWSQLIGNETHNCSYLPSGKKLSYLRVINLPEGSTEDEKMAVASRVKKIIANTKKIQNRLPSWKKTLLDDLELDVLNDTSEEGSSASEEKVRRVKNIILNTGDTEQVTDLKEKILNELNAMQKDKKDC